MTLASYASYADQSPGRFFPEAESLERPLFQRDRDRVVHSTALRRLKHKTQVFVEHEGDYYRTRLTHSLEVAQVARTIAGALGLNPELTEAVALAHDLGHTPFGHTGEDALHALMGPEKTAALLEKGVIEVAPLAYMRGRTLAESFVILDEAQNTTREQMKMFLTRLGYSARAVVTGDKTQIDLDRARDSGLAHALRILERIEDIAVVELTPIDVVRHPLVQAIVRAYAADAGDETRGR